MKQQEDNLWGWGEFDGGQTWAIDRGLVYSNFLYQLTEKQTTGLLKEDDGQ